jgi:type IV secretion system protein VirB6
MSSSYLTQKTKIKIAIMLGKTIAALVIVGVIVYFVFCFIAPFLQMDKVIYRYEPTDSQDTYRLQEEMTIRGDGQYVDISNNYGQWRRFNRTKIAAGTNLKLTAQGQVSLCQAYVPPYNLQQTSANDNTGQPVPIPRVEDTSSKGVPLILNATTGEWRNVANVFLGDGLIVTVNANNEGQNVTETNRMANTSITADCRPGSYTYSPVCNRHTLWNDYVDNYSSSTWTINEKTGSHSECDHWNGFGVCFSSHTVNEYNDVTHCCRCNPSMSGHARAYVSATDPTTIGSFTNLSDIDWTHKRSPSTSQVTTNPYYGSWGGNTHWDSHSNSGGPSFYSDSNPCKNIIDDANYDKNQTFWWYINGTGLLSRHDTTSNGTPTNPTSLGSTSSFTALHPYLLTDAYITNFPGPYLKDSDRVIFQGDYPSEGYYQLRIYDGDNAYADNQGGYVIYVKQTKCKRQNGEVKSDSGLSDRGKVQVYFGGDDDDPNAVLDSSKIGDLSFNNTIAYITAPTDSHIWVRIKNVQSDYAESFGSYNVALFAQSIENQAGLFQTEVMGPLMSSIKGYILSKATTVFRNMICYKNADKTSCSSFFSYLSNLLVLYIMSYGLLFWLGVVQVSHKDLVIRLIKIAILAGLMNDKTFDLFSAWLLPFISGATDNIIANLAGFPNGDNIFLFADPILSEIFFSTRFWAKILALTAVGPHGIIFFIIAFVSAFIFIMAIIQAIAAYFMAFCAQALLISIAPIFLSFMLFDVTKHLFDAWLKMILRYILEPIIILGGIIVLTSMFTVMMDYAMPYSVVIKCAIRIYSPFQLIMQFLPIPGLDALGSIPIFCLNGFVPWGFDVKDGNNIISLRFDFFVMLLILSFLMYHYIPFASKIVVALLGEGGPSSTAPAQRMTSDARNFALKPIGMDDKSRAIRKHRAAGRRESMKASEKSEERQEFVRTGKITRTRQISLKDSITSKMSSIKNDTSTHINQKLSNIRPDTNSPNLGDQNKKISESITRKTPNIPKT